MRELKKKLSAALAVAMIIITMPVGNTVAYADTVYKYSPKWYTTKNENTGEVIWHINDNNGELIKKAWICDYESTMEEKPWYLIDENGDMVVHPIVKDGEGYYYAINDSVHDGSYGHMLHGDGEYYGVNLTFNQKHDGHFGAITNPEGIKELTKKFKAKEIDSDYTFLKIAKVKRYYYSGSNRTEPVYYELTVIIPIDGSGFQLYDGDTLLATDSTYLIEKGTAVTYASSSVSFNNTVIHASPSIASPACAYGWNVEGDNASESELGSKSNVEQPIEEDITVSLATSTMSPVDCVLAGTLITLADGTQKKVENLKADDMLLAYDLFEGRMVQSKLLGCVRTESEDEEIIRLKTAGGNELAIAGAEAIFDMDARTYVTINSKNYKSMIGHHIMINNDGKYGTDTITEAELSVEKAVFYEVYTEKTLNYIGNNIVVKYPDAEPLTIFTLDTNYKIDQVELQKDVDRYGYFTYEEFADVMSRDFFDKMGVAIQKVIAIKSGYSYENYHDAYEGFEEELMRSLEAISTK